MAEVQNDDDEEELDEEDDGKARIVQNETYWLIFSVAFIDDDLETVSTQDNYARLRDLMSGSESSDSDTEEDYARWTPQRRESVVDPLEAAAARSKHNLDALPQQFRTLKADDWRCYEIKVFVSICAHMRGWKLI
jgi:hypothetical protein